jgi:carbonic anhydrase
MELFCDEVMSDLLDDSLATASLDMSTLKWSNPQHGGGCAAGHFIKWHTIKNQEDSVTQDVARIRSHPLVPKNIPIYGYVYDVKTGRLVEVPKACQVGRAF